MRALPFAVLLTWSVAQAQLQKSTEPFVGHWVGTDEYRKGNDVLTQRVDLYVTPPDKHQRLTMRYNFPSEAGSTQDMVKFLKLAPDRETLWWWHEGEIEEFAKFKTIGLREFAAHGAGAFRADDCGQSGSVPRTGQGQQQQSCTRYRISLDGQTLVYTVEFSSDGKVYGLLSRWTFKKEN